MSKNLMHPSAMTKEKKPRRRLCGRQKYLWVPIGVNFRQLLLQRAVNTSRRMKVRMAIMNMEMKMNRVKKSNEKERVELKEMDASFPQLIAERLHAQEENMHALEESAWTQVCCDAMEALLFAP